MADIRINSLPSTATSFNTDDYIAIDGASAGTRKMLAANPPFTDVTLGASGPSVKSSLSARAPRQGLVFDGTAGATVANVPAFGTGAWTVVWVGNPASFAASPTVVAGANGSFALRHSTTGTVQFYKVGGSVLGTSSTAMPVGKPSFFALTKDASGTVTFYPNGIAEGTTVNDSATDYTVAATTIGSKVGNFDAYTGTLQVAIYNRALSAAEVVALYEAGDPASADYNSASNTALNTSAFQQSALPYTTFTSATATGFSATATGTGNYVAVSRPQFPVRIGCRYRVSFSLTLNSGGAPRIKLALFGGSDYSAFQQSTAGSNVMEFVATGTTSTAEVHVWTTGTTTDFTISNFSVTPLGLLLAPDAAQAGGGLVWYDTSGNAANISWTSGVSWNVPTSGNVTSGTVLNLRAGGSNQDITLTPSGTGGHVNISSSGSPVLDFTRAGTLKWEAYSDSSDNFIIRDAVGAANRLTIATSTGNFLIGGSIDGGQKLQVSGTALFAGSINDALLYWKNTDTTGYSGVTLQNNSGTGKGGFGYANASASFFTDSVYMYSAGSLRLATGGTTTALTLDSSQNATFAGNLTVSGNQSVFGGGSATNAPLTVTYTSATKEPFAISNSASGGKTWYIGDGTGVGAGNFAIRNATDATNVLAIGGGGNMEILGSIKTSAPSGGTAGAWKLGIRVAATTTLDTTQYLQVDIGGTLYKVALVTS